MNTVGEVAWVNEVAGLSLVEYSTADVGIVGPNRLYDWREARRLPVPGGEFFPHHKRAVLDYKREHTRWKADRSFPEPQPPTPPTWVPGKRCLARGEGLWELKCLRGLVRAVCLEVGGFEYLPGSALHGVDIVTGVDTRLVDYQLQALRSIAIRQWCRVALATNAGKGAIIALAAQWARKHNISVVILCDEISVWQALQEECRKWAPDMPVSLVGAGVKLLPDAGVALAMVPTLARRLDVDGEWAAWCGNFGMVLADEADKATAPTWRTVLDAMTGSTYRVGFSGTFPTTGTYADLHLEELFGPVVVREKNAALIARGISARPSVVFHRYPAGMVLPMQPHRKFYRKMKGAQLRQWIFEQAIVHNAARHAFIARLISPNTPTAIIVNRVEHGQELAAAIPGSVFVDGSCTPREREEALVAFRSGQLYVVIATKIFDRGTNALGTVADLILASGEGSNRQNLQRIGRGLRRAGGKEFLNIIDIIDTGHEYLHTAAAKRVTLYNEEQFEVEVR